MNIDELKQLISNNIKSAKEEKIQENQLFMLIDKSDVTTVSKFMKDQFKGTNIIFEQLFGTDFPAREEMELIYTWWLIDDHLLVHFRVVLPYADLKVKSIQDDWIASNWHERETWELLGIEFEGHPNLKQFLLSDALFGKHPLRKSFKLISEEEE